MNPYPRYEAGNTIQFTQTFSLTETVSLVNFHVYDPTNTLVNTESAVSSNANNWYAYYTIPVSPYSTVDTLALYRYTFFAKAATNSYHASNFFEVYDTGVV